MRMTQQELRLWQRLQSLQLDVPDHPVPFSERLCEENGWSKRYAVRVIEEYRKFLLLSAAGERMPSDAVDQAWHLHLLDTRAYWSRLCAEVLGFSLHHVPSRGGTVELGRFRALYEDTLKAYRTLFEREPPADIWPDANTRFAVRHRRVNSRETWLMPRYTVAAQAFAIASLLGLAGCSLIGTDSQSAILMLGIAFLIGIPMFPLLAFLIWTWEQKKSRGRSRYHACGSGGSGGIDCGGGCGSGCGGGGCGSG